MIPVIYSEDFLTDYPTVDCESPDRTWMIRSRLNDIGEFIEPVPCEEYDLLLCHSEPLIEAVRRNKEVYDVACKAAGGAIKAAVIGLQRPSFALIRPPGHHAGHHFNGGFCFFNNIVIAMKRLLSDGAVTSALILDIDLHYGNGTYDIVSSDDRITFRNIDSHTRAQFLEDVEDALKDASTFGIVGCSAGFDTYIKDWGGILLTEDFKTIGRMLASSNPHVFAVLEGGYYIPDLGTNVHAFLEGMQETCS